MNSLVLLVLLVMTALVVVALAAQKGRRSGGSGAEVEEVGFDPCRELFSPAERSFHGVLEQAVEGEFKVFGKVRLGDLVKPQKGLSRSQWARLRNRIQQKHIDFVICHTDTLAVAAVVELDDASHRRKDRSERDEFVDKALASAGISLLRFPVRKGYAVAGIRERMAGALGLKLTESESPDALEEHKAVEISEVSESHAQAPGGEDAVEPAAFEMGTQPAEPVSRVCPTCNSTMVKRQAKKGKYEGQWFWACSAFPKCRKILTVAD